MHKVQQKQLCLCCCKHKRQKTPFAGKVRDRDHCAGKVRDRDHCAGKVRDRDHCAGKVRDRDHCAGKVRDRDFDTHTHVNVVSRHLQRRSFHIAMESVKDNKSKSESESYLWRTQKPSCELLM
jgi:hypothetical protein